MRCPVDCQYARPFGGLQSSAQLSESHEEADQSPTGSLIAESLHHLEAVLPCSREGDVAHCVDADVASALILRQESKSPAIGIHRDIASGLTELAVKGFWRVFMPS